LTGKSVRAGAETAPLPDFIEVNRSFLLTVPSYLDNCGSRGSRQEALIGKRIWKKKEGGGAALDS
jgi:hypothetical protein